MRFYNNFMKFKKLSFILFLTFFLAGCSSFDDVKGWMKEGTKEHRDQEKKSTKVGKTKLKTFLAKNHCRDGTSAKIISSVDDRMLYEVTCVRKSQTFIVECNEFGCKKN